ncbi:hypothetical protein BEL04_15515 [Mucilaginibacter sp. PPCGB 2223]|uniref:HU domain-containing protein n=1 Tax=Mucilaginibacter sp. PPCGB 2223 TaxID=1886027 RepID=UPI0008260609|nr:hypothetical protein [Mucilaginibacter sp. PPCGB 2223]OCX51433.1 hypothetical protein BEL04_15515 [Mucilaginibacter sp. PPCGB 2223]
MDITAFINDLLAREGVLIVPGLGTFNKTRVEGYYNKDQQHFYPPTRQIQFKTDQSDDSTLANLIAEERQISVASAKYFIEKFVTHILEQAGTGSVPFGNMGAFSTRRGSLIFTPSELNETDEMFYGLAPVRLKRNSSFRQQQAAFVPPPKPAEPPPAPVPEPMPVIPQPEPVEEPAEPGPVEEEYIEEEEAEHHRVNIWLVLALIIVVIGVAIIGIYIYKPALFSRFKPILGKLSHKTAPAPAISTADSLKRAQQAQKDIGIVHTVPSLQKDSVGTDTFRIVVGSWQGLKKATQDAEDHTKQGINAEVHRSGGKYQVTVATFNNNDSAKAALPVFKEKLKKQDIRIQTYPFKKP